MSRGLMKKINMNYVVPAVITGALVVGGGLGLLRTGKILAIGSGLGTSAIVYAGFKGLEIFIRKEATN